MMAHQLNAHTFNNGVDPAHAAADPSRSNSHQDNLYENYLASLQGSMINQNTVGNNVVAQQLGHINNNLMAGDENNSATMQQPQMVQQPVVYVGNNTLGNAGALGGFLLNPLASIFGIGQAAQQTNVSVVPTAGPGGTVFQGQQQIVHDHLSNPSPAPLAFMTPNQGPTPSTTPEPFMTPRHGPTPSSLSGAVHTASFGGSSLSGAGHSEKEAWQQDEACQATSELQGGIAFSVVGGLGSMASYIKSSFSAGIPFHSADKAMTSMKSLNKRWWEGGIAGNKRRRGAECDDDEGEVTECQQNGRATKRRKSNGSKLSIKLLKNYEEMGVDPSATGVSDDQSGQRLSKWTVDTTIVNSRRQNSYDSDLCGSRGIAADHGYNAFNNVDAMYMIEPEPENNVSSYDASASSGHFQEDAVFGSPTSSYYTTREYEETASIVSNSTTITNTFVNDAMQSIHDMLEDRNQRHDENELLGVVSNPRDWVKKTIRSEMMAGLEEAQGDVSDKRFKASLEVLQGFYKSSGRDARISPWAGSELSGGPGEFDLLEGSYLNLSRPSYVESIGFNRENEYMYNLGRMSFDMFMPREIICSVQKTFSTIKVIGEKDDLPNLVPASLREEVDALSASLGDSSRAILRSYNIEVEMTIEPPSSVGMAEIKGTPSPKKRLRAVLSVEGYILPDPEVPNRLTVWFTGGRLAPSDDRHDDKEDCSGGEPGFEEYGDFSDWSNIFAKGKWRRTLSEKARSVAARLVLGAEVPDKMEENGSMAYTLTRPVGGHGKVYLDVLYLDEDTLVMRGHHGTVYAMARSNNIQRFQGMGIADKQ